MRHRLSFILFLLSNLILLVIQFTTLDLENRNDNSKSTFQTISKYIMSFSETLPHHKQAYLAAMDEESDHQHINLRRFQSLSILMNFGHDGSSSVVLLDLNNVNLFWYDSGICKHGQMYDPSNNICRDIICDEGYHFTQHGCEMDTEFKPVDLETHSANIPPEMTIELDIINKLCLLDYDLTQNLSCPNSIKLTNYDNLTEEFVKELSVILEIDPGRIHNVTLVGSEVKRKNISQAMVESFLADLDEDYYDYEINENLIDSKQNVSNKPILNLPDLSFFNTSMFEKPAVQSDDMPYETTTEEMESVEEPVKIGLIEQITLTFTIKDKALFGENIETLQLYFNLLAAALLEQKYTLLKQKVKLTNVREIKSANYNGWCNNKADVMTYYSDGFRILASESKKYYIYVNQTQNIYSTGFFFLSILYKSKQLLLRPDFKRLDNRSDEFSGRTLDITKYNLTDITSFILANNDSNETNVETSAVLVTCDRKPKVRIPCSNFAKIRVKICEFEYNELTKSYCWHIFNKCYSIDEYEYDTQEPDTYIRVCQLSEDDTNNEDLITKLKSMNNTDLSVLIPGWLSVFASLISLTALLSTLITYFMFSELRNIPGWNIINLTIALVIAQVAFTCGSFFNELPLVCFILSLMTHYGFLAGFFWMNVIAFDLYRNFREKSSHVLLQTIAVKDRLPKYALFGWISPLLIVLSGLITDLVIKDSKSEAPFRPCYASYLGGCNDVSEKLNDLLIDSPYLANVTNRTDVSFRHTSYFENETCIDSAPLIKYILMKSCWITNGRANLVFFGLPIGVIIIINGIYYSLTIYNIRKKKNVQKKNNMRRFSKVKLPADQDIKFFVEMAFIMGFTWISGFLLLTFPSGTSNDNVFKQILSYIFILSNASMGVFIFFAFIFRPEVKFLYYKLYHTKILGLFRKKSEDFDRPKRLSNTTVEKALKSYKREPQKVRISECSTTPFAISNTDLSKLSVHNKQLNASLSNSEFKLGRYLTSSFKSIGQNEDSKKTSDTTSYNIENSISRLPSCSVEIENDEVFVDVP